MTLKEQQITELAAQLFAQYGLANWTFQFDRAKRRLGRCNSKKKIISVSRYLLDANPVSTLENTLRHEIAHALTPGHNHDAAWRAKCVEVGAIPERCASEEVVQNHAWTATCPNCGRKARRHRRTPLLACRKCCTQFNGGRYAPQFAFRWERTEESEANTPLQQLS